jgi:hypothetical protein
MTDNHRRGPRRKPLLYKLLNLKEILRTSPLGLRRKGKAPLRRHGISTMLDLRPANPLCIGSGSNKLYERHCIRFIQRHDRPSTSYEFPILRTSPPSNIKKKKKSQPKP